MDIIGGYISGLEKGKGTESIDDTKKAVGQNEQKRRQLLKENGYPEDYLDDIYKCALCKDTGSIGEKRCECFKTLLIKIACAKSNVDFSLAEYDFDKFDLKLFSEKSDDGISPKDNMKNILSYVKVFMEEFENKETKSLLFTGNTGVGKTFLSGCIAKRMIENGYDVAYHSAARMCEILDNYKFKKEDADSLSYEVKRLYNCELLIIDDLGTEFKTSYTLSAIYDLINSRHNNNRKIIINTNLSIKDLKDIYSERIFSRFLGEFNILEFIGEDLRIKGIIDNNG